MPKKEISKKIKKVQEKGKVVMKREEEILKWKTSNLVEKRFFSLEDREQDLLEKTYIIFAQACPKLTWENFLECLSKSDKCDTATKSAIKKVIGI